MSVVALGRLYFDLSEAEANLKTVKRKALREGESLLTRTPPSTALVLESRAAGSFLYSDQHGGVTLSAVNGHGGQSYISKAKYDDLVGFTTHVLDKTSKWLDELPEEWYVELKERASATADRTATPATVKELVDAAIERVRKVQGGQRDEGAREMALAITHLEDAAMRFTRGLAMRQGKFAPADLEKSVVA